MNALIHATDSYISREMHRVWSSSNSMLDGIETIHYRSIQPAGRRYPPHDSRPGRQRQHCELPIPEGPSRPGHRRQGDVHMNTAPVESHWARTGGRASRPEACRAQRMDRQRPRVLRLRAVLVVRGPGVPDGLLPVGQPDHRPDRLARHLCRRVLHPTHRRGRARCLGRPARPQERPGLGDVPDGPVDLPGRRTAHLRTGRRPRADSAGRTPHGPGLRRGRRARRRQRDDRGALPGRQPRVLRELQPAGHPGRLDPGHRRAATPRRVPSRRRVPDLGLADPVPAQRLRHPGRLPHPPAGAGAAGLRRAGRDRSQAQAAVHRPAAHPSVGNRSSAF